MKKPFPLRPALYGVDPLLWVVEEATKNLETGVETAVIRSTTKEERLKFLGIQPKKI